MTTENLKRPETYLPAQAARQITDNSRSMDGYYMRVETERAISMIATAAHLGKYEILYDCTNETVLERLSTLGYKVEISRGNRNGDWMTISW